VRFEWDAAKAAGNRRKHGVSFETATLVFSDPDALTDQDRIEGHEYRWRTIGLVDGVTLILVAHVDREEDGEDVVRIISARRADRTERKRYEQAREI
jgi:uncharacterized DUF497 family protein